MSYNDKALQQRPARICDHPLDGHTRHGPWCGREDWDSARYMAPDPELPVEDQLAWYKVASHVLLLNCSERCRRNAAAEADKALARRAA